MQKITPLLLLLFLCIQLTGQEKEAPLFDISLHGFVAVDVAHNTRASMLARNGHIFLFPLPESLDDDGRDLNDRGDFDIDAAHSRFGLHIKGPTANGITTFGLIEADFLGDSHFANSNFRLRHAFVRFGYNDFSLLAGQTWHPFFIPENFPQMVNTNVGVPTYPLSRNPQLRFSWQVENNIELIAALIEQNNFRNAGFTSGTEEAGIPEVVGQLKLGGTGAAWASFTAGYKKLAIPTNIVEQKDRAKVDGFHYQATFRYRFPQFTLRMGGIYGDNLTDQVIPGGVGQIVNTDNNPKYESLSVANGWIDINSNNTTWDPGFFAGYLQSMGASNDVVVEESLSLAPGLNNLLFIAPRLKYLIGSHAWIGLEYLYAKAAWGSSYDNHGVAEDLEDYVNHRTLISFRYNF